MPILGHHNNKYVMRSELFCFRLVYSYYFEQCNFSLTSMQLTLRRVFLERRFFVL